MGLPDEGDTADEREHHRDRESGPVRYQMTMTMMTTKIPPKAERVRILTDAESASYLPQKRCVKTVHIHSYIHYMAQNHELEQLTSLLQSREEIGYGTDIDCTLEGYVCNLASNRRTGNRIA